MNPVNPNTPIHSKLKRGYSRGLNKHLTRKTLAQLPQSTTYPMRSRSNHSGRLSTELVDNSVCNLSPIAKTPVSREPFEPIAQNIDTAIRKLQTHGKITLKAINPDLNIMRYYTIRTDRNLFGETTISTSYGRIGSKGQLTHHYFESMDAGDRFLQATLRKRFNSKKRIGVDYSPAT